MAIKKPTYVEPGDYFSSDMRKAIDKYEKEQAKKVKDTEKPKTGKKK